MSPFPGASRVVQGFFFGGHPRALAAPHVAAAVQASMAQRSGRPPVQRRSHPNAVELPAGFLDAHRGPGQPLPSGLREQMERALGANFSGVRVHQGPQASAIGALAFTSGSDLFFAPGQYNPGSLHGQRLIAHELTHVVQQRAGRVRNPFGTGVAVVHDHVLEAEAERMARGVAQLQPAPAAWAGARPVRRGVVQRLSYQSSTTNSTFRITETVTAKGNKIEAEDRTGSSASLIYSDVGLNEVSILNLEALNMTTAGTRVSYLLIYILALRAEADHRNTVSLGTAVFRHAINSPQDAQQYTDSNKAAAVYEALGFDVSSATAANSSTVSVLDVRNRALAKIRGMWVEVDDENLPPRVTASTPLLASGDGSSGSKCCCCFLTTACTASGGLPDDCEELTVLRAFRDGYLSATTERRALVERYYEIAPPIVAAIEGSGRGALEYEEIYRTVAACVRRIRRGDAESALRLYRSMVEELESRWLSVVAPRL